MIRSNILLRVEGPSQVGQMEAAGGACPLGDSRVRQLRAAWAMVSSPSANRIFQDYVEWLGDGQEIEHSGKQQSGLRSWLVVAR